MQKQSLVFSGAAMRRLAVLIAAGGVALASTVARADDAANTIQQQDAKADATPAATTTQTDAPKKVAKDSKQDSGKQIAAAKTDKKTKDYSTASTTPKFDLMTPASKLNFYGTAEVGFATASFKPACGNKTVHASESYYQLTVGTDIKLAGDVTLGIEVGSARGVTRFH